jgi:hypothetical protein
VTDTPETDNLARGNHVVPTEFAQQLERERDEARQQRDGLRSGIEYASEQLTAVTEQRDRLAEALILDWQSGAYPDSIRVVLATDGESVYVATFDTLNGWEDAHTVEPIDYHITHWCELPELPDL